MSLSKDKRSWKTDVRRGSNRDVLPATSHKFSGIRRGLLVTTGEDGTPRVDFEGNPDREPIAAISTVDIAESDVGREAVLMFEDGDPRRPVLLGLVQVPGSQRVQPAALVLDAQQIILNSEKEVVLRCGDASITLTRAGKILIQGNYVLSRSSGVNRIRGGSVQIN